MRKKAIFVGFIALTSVHCDDHLLGADMGFEVQCDHDPPLTYENFGEGFLKHHCNGCHSSFREFDWQRSGAPSGVDFDDWESLLDFADRVLIRTENGSMPPAGGPVQEERELFIEWMECEVLPIAGRN